LLELEHNWFSQHCSWRVLSGT